MNREKQEYLARAFGCGIHEGDTVRLVRSWTEEEGEHLAIDWLEDMNNQIGKTGIVSEVFEDGDFLITFEDDQWWLPYFVLEKVENR